MHGIHAESTQNSRLFPPTYQRPDSSFCAEDPGLTESTGPPRNTQVRQRARQRPRSRRRGLGRQAPLWLAKERSRIPGAVADRARSKSSRDVFEASGPLRRYSRSHASTMPRHAAPAQHREITPNTPATTAATRQPRPPSNRASRWGVCDDMHIEHGNPPETTTSNKNRRRAKIHAACFGGGRD